MPSARREPTSPQARARNRRGEGRLLRAEILAAAAGILAREGSEEAVTLRSVAREIGIAAPSIYAHFPDRQAIVDAVLDAAFAELHERVRNRPEGRDAVENLVSGCLAYVGFAIEQPATYRILFGRSRSPEAVAGSAPHRRAGFTALADSLAACVAAGRSASVDPSGDAAEIWSALHGAASLRAAAPGFGWPPITDSVPRLVHRIGLIIPPA